MRFTAGSNEEFNEFFDKAYKKLFGTVSDHTITAVYNTIVRNKLNDIRTLAAVTDRQLKDCRGVGPMAFKMIRELRAEANKELDSGNLDYEKRWDSLDHILTVTICGSMKQRSLFPFAERLLLEKYRNKGCIVHTPIIYYEDELPRKFIPADTKQHIHEEKIMSSDFIMVVDGLFEETAYYGLHTQNEIRFAENLGIPVFYLSKIMDVNFDRE